MFHLHRQVLEAAGVHRSRSRAMNLLAAAVHKPGQLATAFGRVRVPEGGPVGTQVGLGSDAQAGIRPEEVQMDTPDRADTWAAEGTVILVEPNGPLRTVHVDLGDEVVLVSCRLQNRPELHSRVSVWALPEKIHWFSGPGGLRAGTAAGLGLTIAALEAVV